MVVVSLTIGGSDSSGGAGIQADLKTFSAFGVYGASVLTALTAQNTQGVRAIVNVEPWFIARQIDAVAEDLPITARQVWWGGILAFAIGAVAGLVLVHQCGLPILVIGLASIAAGYFYTAWPVALGYLAPERSSCESSSGVE